jgi:hypothetical protein
MSGLAFGPPQDVDEPPDANLRDKLLPMVEGDEDPRPNVALRLRRLEAQSFQLLTLNGLVERPLTGISGSVNTDDLDVDATGPVRLDALDYLADPGSRRRR